MEVASVPVGRMHVTADLAQAHRLEDVELAAGATGMDLLDELGLAPDAHILLRGDAPIPVDEPLQDGERLVILSAVSGGS